MNNVSVAYNTNQAGKWIEANLHSLNSLYGSDAWKSMLSNHPVFVNQAHIDEMENVIRILTEISGNPAFQAIVAPHLPAIAKTKTPAKGVLFGYDFHLSDSGPKLIEVNTNAGAAYLNHFLNTSQQPCCDTVARFMRPPIETSQPFEQRLLTMFLKEFEYAAPGEVLRTIAIIDERPEEQFLYPEFILFKDLFEKNGIQALIVEPEDLRYDGDKLRCGDQAIDLVYNRHCDFYLEDASLKALKQAYLNRNVVLTPNPHAYGFAADKRLLAHLSDEAFLAQLSLPQAARTQLLKALPKTRIVTLENADRLWTERKLWFFKPMTGYGSRATYFGGKLTRKTWQAIIDSGNYIAQEFVPPSQGEARVEGEMTVFKQDFRNYVYDGETLMLAARLYRGQTTNMKTPGGGFATVYGA